MENMILIKNNEDWSLIVKIGKKLGWKWAGGKELEGFAPSMPFILYENYEKKNEKICHHGVVTSHRLKDCVDINEFTKLFNKAVSIFFE